MKGLLVVFVLAMQVACAVAPLSARAQDVQPTPYARQSLEPVDEAMMDSGFAAFYKNFAAMVQKRDAAGVIASIDPTAQYGLRTLREILSEDLRLMNPEHVQWRHLLRAIDLGGAFTMTRGAQLGRREFCAPYTYTAYPRPVTMPQGSELDPWVIIAPRAAVRAEPRATARVLMWLSHELVQVNGSERPGDRPQWYGVIAPNGLEGWVATSEIRDPEDYHVCFAQIDGRWLLTVFTRGLPPAD